jgi:hypothetical protein
MKKCPYCGKEYSDDIERCVTDNELLLGGNPQTPQGNEEITTSTTSSPLFKIASAIISSATPWTERQLCIFEVVLVCAIAFGGGILSSAYYLLVPSYGGSGSESFDHGIYRWLVSFMREVSALALLWYILMRRGKSFLDLGLTWARKDILWAVVLGFVGSLAFRAVYDAIYFVGLTAVSHKASSEYVGNMLFGAGISVVTILFQFLNPFFEELIVRAYVMTEVKCLTISVTKAIIISTLLQTSYHFFKEHLRLLVTWRLFLYFRFFTQKLIELLPLFWRTSTLM